MPLFRIGNNGLPEMDATEGAQVRKDLGAAFGPRPMGHISGD